MKQFYTSPAVWLSITLVLLAACTYLPLWIRNDDLRNFIMRWVLVPVSIVIILYTYPIGIEVFRNLALK